MRLLRLSVHLVLACLLTCSCSSFQAIHPHKLLDLKAARMSPTHAPIVVDGGRSSEKEWEGSVSVPLAVDGSAEFLWNDEGVYILVAGSRLPAYDPEAICVDISDFISPSNCPSVQLEMKYGGTMGKMELSRIVRSRNWKEALMPPFDDSLVRFSSHADIAQQGIPWSAELFLPWRTLSTQGRPRGKLFIHAYRLVVYRFAPGLTMTMEEGPATSAAGL